MSEMVGLVVFKGDRPSNHSSAEKFVEHVNNQLGHPLTRIIEYSNLVFERRGSELCVTEISNDKPLESIAKAFYVRDYHGHRAERYAVARYLIARGAHVFNTDTTSTETISKLEQMVVLSTEGISIPDFVYSNRPDSIKIDLGLPLIVKSIVDSGGRMNFLVTSEAEAIKQVNNMGGKAVIQRYIENDGDYRVVVLYGQPVIAYKRSRIDPKANHLNNVFQGAKRTIIEDKDVISLALAVAKLLSREFCGVDIIRDNVSDRLYVLECNFNAGMNILGDGVDEQYFKRAAEIIASKLA